jgi:hypothetical protein
VRPVLLELLRLPVDRVHGHILPSASVIEMTNASRRM